MKQKAPIRVLLIEDEEYDVRRVRNTLRAIEEQIQITEIVSTGEGALHALEEGSGFDVAILDFQISGGLYGERLIRRLREKDPLLQVIVITKMTINQTDLHFANQLIASGAYWYGTKYPSDIEEFIYQPTDFILTIINAHARRQLELDRIRSQKRLDRKIARIVQERPLVGESTAIAEVRDLIEKFSVTPANVLIVGESGSGKELIARNIHYQSDRRYENFVPVNCAAIPRDLIESELFGFVKGAFTGAKEDKTGLFEQANNGTIFLDEISELPYTAQAKLLRVLETGELDKIGRKRSYRVDVRVISATNRDMSKLLEEDKFREDLYYRLNILNIKAPPLRERQGDLKLLIDHFMQHYGQDLGIVPPKIEPSALEMMESHRWPGNVRQLKNVVQRLVIMGRDGIDRSMVESALEMQPGQTLTPLLMTTMDVQHIRPLRDIEEDFRRQYFTFVRNQSRTDAEAAGKLGLAPPNFHRMCKELGLK